MSSKINNYENTNRLFDKAADLIGLDTDTRLLLKTPFREIQVEVPLRLEDGSLEIFLGYRVQHNAASLSIGAQHYEGALGAHAHGSF